MPNPLCPGSTCQAIPSVTGIQSNLPTGSSPFRMPFDGYVTAWKIFLSKPARTELKFFNDMFGSPPQAGVSVIRRKSVSGGRTKYELKNASPVQGLNPYLGTDASFKLKKPMRVNKGSLIALTVPTWAPALAAGNSLTGNNTWRASRDPGTCGAGGIQMAKPQIKIGSLRFYSCEFTRSRLLYTVKISRKAPGPGGKGPTPRVVCLNYESESFFYSRRPRTCNYYFSDAPESPITTLAMVITRRLHWSHWGRTTALGAGQWHPQGAGPWAPVKVKLSHPTQACGHRVFTTVQIRVKFQGKPWPRNWGQRTPIKRCT